MYENGVPELPLYSNDAPMLNGSWNIAVMVTRWGVSNKDVARRRSSSVPSSGVPWRVGRALKLFREKRSRACAYAYVALRRLLRNRRSNRAAREYAWSPLRFETRITWSSVVSRRNGWRSEEHTSELQSQS